jgi:hypothetical protein
MLRRKFRIHGDNIVECERIFAHLKTAHGAKYSCYGPFGAPVTPCYYLKSKCEVLEFLLFPGFGRWNQNILDIVTSFPRTLREAADALVTEVKDFQEKPIFAVEYCNALPAGNNAWQRSGRAYSFAQAKIPYFYLTEIGGLELTADRNKKADRYPNPAVPFSYLAQSVRSCIPVFPVYECNPAISGPLRQHFSGALNQGIFENFLFSLLHDKDTESILKQMSEKVFTFIDLLQKLPDSRKNEKDMFQARLAYFSLMKGGSFSQFLETGYLFPWSKAINITLSKTAKNFLSVGCEVGMGITKASLPICYIPSSKREIWSQKIEKIYKDQLSTDLRDWLSKSEDLVICWIAGFKPKGDDSRPDRGLVPLARMLFGDDIDILSFIYGPGKKTNWNLMETDPAALMKQNGLWESILTLSSAVIIDSKTQQDAISRGYIQAHWQNHRYEKSEAPKTFFIAEEPASYKENDVDTVLHNMIDHCGAVSTFEGLCNPPGGDWSGISILDFSEAKEYRWLGLNRVSGTGNKRPDHVFQIFLEDSKSMLLFSVESKELGRNVEIGIGPMLKKYLTKLFLTKPNAVRHYPNGQWETFPEVPIKFDYPILTGVAFISANREQIKTVLKKAKTDIAWGLTFKDNGKACEILSMANTKPGKAITIEIENILRKRKSAYRITSI